MIASKVNGHVLRRYYTACVLHDVCSLERTNLRGRCNFPGQLNCCMAAAAALTLARIPQLDRLTGVSHNGAIQREPPRSNNNRAASYY
jgi:hypothetical protein